MSEAEISATFNRFKQELQDLATKAGELELDIEEHKLVIETMEPLEPSRTCFRLINGILVERSVKEVLPALKANKDGITKVIAMLMEQYKKKEIDFQEFQKKHNIRDGKMTIPAK
ncbi:hypothetical protein BB561_000372 [Smittium simulii]|uniref:Prefoldin subunit 2 n=1 Tax=Smittium simulii TaxID=133385 RepID=A0A2T9YZK9_9FUNG|nr:hypothetical protein BB561_000372 [Smittium simulii]